MVRQILRLVASIHISGIGSESGNGKGNMDFFSDTLFALSVFVGFTFVVGFFVLMYLWARKQKGPAIVFGMLMQMILPDPKVQHTIEMVTEAKQEKSGQEDINQDGNETGDVD